MSGAPTPPDAPRHLPIGRREWGLALAFMLGLGWMLVSPGQWHIGVRHLEQEQQWWAKGWVMMHGIGRNICAVEFVEVDANGNETKIDRLERIGIDRDKLGEHRPPAQARVYRKQLEGHARRVCAATPADVDLRFKARCAGYDGWDDVFRGKRNICKANNWRQGGRRG